MTPCDLLSLGYDPVQGISTGARLHVLQRLGPCLQPDSVTTMVYSQALAVPRQWDKTYSFYGSRQTLASPSDRVLCLMRTHSIRHNTLSDGDVNDCLSYPVGLILFQITTIHSEANM